MKPENKKLRLTPDNIAMENAKLRQRLHSMKALATFAIARIRKTDPGLSKVTFTVYWYCLVGILRAGYLRNGEISLNAAVDAYLHSEKMKRGTRRATRTALVRALAALNAPQALRDQLGPIGRRSGYSFAG